MLLQTERMGYTESRVARCAYRPLPAHRTLLVVSVQFAYAGMVVLRIIHIAAGQYGHL